MSNKITGEVWEFGPESLTTGDRLLLLRLADSAGTEHRMVWESVATLAKACHVTPRNIQMALRRLKSALIIEDVPDDERPPVSKFYKSKVRRILPSEMWLDVPVLGTDPEPETETDIPSSGRGENISGVNRASPNPVLKVFKETSSLSDDGHRGKIKKPQTRAAQARAAAAEDADLDPANFLDPKPEIPAPSTGRGLSPDQPLSLARELQQLFWCSPDTTLRQSSVNTAMLAKNFKDRMARGVTPAEIRAAGMLYADVTGYRNPKKAAGIDFVGRLDFLLEQGREHKRSQQVESVEDYIGNAPAETSETTSDYI